MSIVPRFRDLQECARRELWASLALRHCTGLGARSCKLLLDKFGSAYEALAAQKSWQSVGINPRVVHIAVSEGWRKAAKAEWDALGRSNPRVLLWQNECYPAYLREISDPPLLLYGEGDFSLLSSPCIAVIGSRKASEHGQKVAQHLARELASCGICVVAGMAQGIDSIAHQVAIKEIGRSIGFLGSGIDICYPSFNVPIFESMKKHGLLLTEFAPGSKPLAKNFPIRNRLISGISLGVLVVEAAEKSGSLITAKNALEQNRDVYVVPGPAMNAHFAGCQKLVREGARAVFTTEDILHDLAPRLEVYGLDPSTLSLTTMHAPNEESEEQRNETDTIATPVSQEPTVLVELQTLEPDLQQIVSFLQQHGASHIDKLAEGLDVSVTTLNVKLMELEISGYVARHPGAYYDIV